MSHDLLTAEEDQIAARSGWGLYWVWQQTQSAWKIQILPTQQFTKQASSSNQVALFVAKQAAQTNGEAAKVARRALYLCNHPPEKKTKR